MFCSFSSIFLETGFFEVELMKKNPVIAQTFDFQGYSVY